MVVELILRDGIERGEFEPVDPRETSRLMMRSLVDFCHPVLIAQCLQDRGRHRSRSPRLGPLPAARHHPPELITDADLARPRFAHVQSADDRTISSVITLLSIARSAADAPTDSNRSAALAALLALLRCGCEAKPPRRRPSPSARSRCSASPSSSEDTAANSSAWCGRATRPISASASPARS